MTIWGVAGMWLGFLAYAFAWFRGGPAERLAAGIMILHCLATVITFKWVIDGHHSPRMILDGVRLLFFGWLCFRSNRWWPFVVLAALAMMSGLHIVTLFEPTLYMAVASAFVGLGYLVDLTLMLGVGERMLAGEPPAGRAAWARSDAVTPPRRQRKRPVRRSGRILSGASHPAPPCLTSPPSRPTSDA
ncbi:hypothetical protein [Brevundimonas sp.]|uniref:hypothetical protein n=1 Tax=Brevundimonas sp. TaxID=1871086 RepID=UPI002FCB774A